jgi:cyclopropane-fatty-acyl-phospholipid synthase
MSTAKERIISLFADSGIVINGSRPHDIKVHDYIKAKLTNPQRTAKAYKNASAHYDLGNDLYAAMLDPAMIYSCGFWEGAKTLEDAQQAKLERICQKLHLKKGMTLLDIGCGWGGFSEYAAHHYGVKVTAITPAAEQVKIARERTKGLPVKIIRQDYREATGSYDRVVSIGMLEHVGPKNYGDFFTQCERLLKPGGLMLHHVIGNNRTVRTVEPWTNKYIFPGGVIPSLAQIGRAIESKLLVEDLENFGPYYDRTLMAWHHNFVKNYPQLPISYDERFYKMWEYYLLSCAGSFRARQLQLWQFVMRKIETSPTYQAVR